MPSKLCLYVRQLCLHFTRHTVHVVKLMCLLLSLCFRLMLREEAPSAPPKNIVASGRTNQSIMVQWQPPPEPQLNGVLRGYVLRYT